MLNNIIRYSITHKLVIGLLTLALIVAGVYSLKQLPVDAVPDITNNQVQVITNSPTLAAQEVERLITFPVEITMATIPQIDEIRSFSRFGLSVVTIVFEEDVDVYWARQQVNERLADAQSRIPEGIGKPGIAPLTTGLGEIYQYVVTTKPGYEDKYDAVQLRTIQDWVVKRQLLGTKGVADVSSFGGYLKQFEIAISPERLKAMQVSISEIFDALENNNQNTGGAYIEKSDKALFIRSEGLVGSIRDIENILVKQSENGTPVLISDVANVQIGSAIRYGATTRNGEGEVVSAIVMMFKGANSAQVIADVKNKNLDSLMGKKFLNKKSFPYGKKINFNSIRKNEIIGEHEVTFSSGKEIIKLNHEAFDRALYSDGALTAAKWLINKTPGLYSMRDLLNFK